MILNDKILKCGADRPVPKSGICLNMIVKDEAPVIERLLVSVQSVIDYFVIVDTGSQDGTPDLIISIASRLGLAGEVHHRPWQDFAFNRQQALELVMARKGFQWVLFLDADEELRYQDPAFYRSLIPGTSYLLEHHNKAVRYWVLKLISITAAEWRWEGVLHEAIHQTKGPHKNAKAREPWIIYHAMEGSRSRGITKQEKYLKDAAILENLLKTDPHNARYRYYLAQSYRDAGDLKKALEHYAIRARLGGFAEEAFVAQYEKAKLSIQLGYPPEVISRECLLAYKMRSSRAEPLWLLAQYLRQLGLYRECRDCAIKGLAIPYPNDTRMLLRPVYDWLLPMEYAISSTALGQYPEAIATFHRILSKQLHPAEVKAEIEQHYWRAKIGQALHQSSLSSLSRNAPSG